jgi:hypothetical protein
MVYVFAAAVAAGGTYAAIGGISKSAPAPSATAAPLPSSPKEMGGGPAVGPNHAQAPNGAPQADESPSGTVLETMDVQRYTYARISAGGPDGTWIAVPNAKMVVGQKIKMKGAMMMANFESKSLKRTFPEIWFGELDDGAGASAASPHAGPAASAGGAAPVEVKTVEKAAGANGYTVAELWAKRTELSGKTVRVRAQVTKANANILGKNYLHVRDGSGQEGTNDLTVTTQAETKVGDVVLLEGVLGLDRDIGSGYKFPTILEDAKIVNP